MGKTLPVTTNCTKKKKNLHWHYLFSPVIPTECGTGRANRPCLLLGCASARYVRLSSVCRVDFKSRKAASLWQPVNHYLWRLAWRSAPTHSANIAGSNCSVLLVCPYRHICHFTHNQFLLNFYFQLLCLFISPRCTVNLTSLPKHLLKYQLHNQLWIIPINYYQSSPANYIPMTPLSLQKQTKREWERKGWRHGGREVEGRDPARN